MKQVKRLALEVVAMAALVLTEVAAACRPSVGYAVFTPPSSDETNAPGTNASDAVVLIGTGKTESKGVVLTKQLVANNLMSARQFSLA